MIRITDTVKPLILSESDSSDDESPKLSCKNNVSSKSTISLQQKHDTDDKASLSYIQSENVQDDGEEIAFRTFMELAKQKSQIDQLKEQINIYTAKKQTETELNVQDLLAQGEDLQGQDKTYNKKSRKNKNHGNSDVDEWENVQENRAIPPQVLQIDVEPLDSVRREERRLEIEKIMMREANRLKRERQVYMHKVHVLCWIAHGNLVSQVLSDQEVLATALSLVPSKFCLDGVVVCVKYFKEMHAWYKSEFTLKLDTIKDNLHKQTLKQTILGQMESKVVTDKKLFVFIFVAIIRALGLQCRVLFNFVAVPLQTPRSKLWCLSTKSKKQSNGNTIKSNFISSQEEPTNHHPEISSNSSKYQDNILHTVDDNSIPEIIEVDSSDDNDILPTQSRKILHRKAKTVISHNTKVNDDRYRKCSALKTGKIVNETQEKLDFAKNLHVSSSNIIAVSPRKTRRTNKNPHIRNNGLNLENHKSLNRDGVCLLEDIAALGESDSDDEFEPRAKCSGKAKLATKKADRPVKSAESDSRTAKVDVWCEVFVADVEEWVSVDVVRGAVQCATSLNTGATRPVRYIVGWDNDNYLKDVTKRYVPHWSAATRSQRAELSWWAEATRPWVRAYGGSDIANAREKRENELLDKMQLEAPLPKTFAAYKEHPLYALERHLLKFEALSPDATPLGHVRGEAVYPRACVHTCHTRYTWYKDAKVVKPNESPCKIVQSRPKWSGSGASYPKEHAGQSCSHGSGAWQRDAKTPKTSEPFKSRPYWHRFLRRKQAAPRPLELFGPWQVEAFAPRVADRTVPRNARGCVDLFQPAMLPRGTVHVTLPGAEQVARRLRIDCAPALVAFTHTRGRSRALCRGVVVCERHATLLEAACVQEQEAQKRKELEDKEARV